MLMYRQENIKLSTLSYILRYEFSTVFKNVHRNIKNEKLL